jgi:RES domain-containing protein
VHVAPADAPDDLVSIAADIPSALRVTTVRVVDLPARWRSYPAPEELAALGTEWVARGTSIALRVPSVIVPTEYNYLLNPAHPDFHRIRIGSAHRFGFDPRLRG